MRHIGMIVALGTTDVDSKKLNGDVVGESIQIGNTFFEKGRGAAGLIVPVICKDHLLIKLVPSLTFFPDRLQVFPELRVIFAHQRPVELANLLVMEVI